MSTSNKRTAANQANAMSSTGPRTPQGKARSSQNARQHGVLSARLILPDESAEQYQALLQSLMTELLPVGTLEQLLVERIAVAVWRQRRLVGAESAAVTEAQSATGLTTLNRILAVANLPYSDKDWAEATLHDLPELASLEDYARELNQLMQAEIDAAAIQRRHPYVWQSLCRDCDADEDMTPPQQLAQVLAELDETHGSLVEWLQGESDYNAKTRRLSQAAATVRQAQAMPQHSDQLARYQAALDNEWYKCMRNLRETQKFRQEQAALNATALPVQTPAASAPQVS